jgi:hypothetical protein
MEVIGSVMLDGKRVYFFRRLSGKAFEFGISTDSNQQPVLWSSSKREAIKLFRKGKK